MLSTLFYALAASLALSHVAGSTLSVSQDQPTAIRNGDRCLDVRDGNVKNGLVQT